ncbi:MAG: hypothetical protein ABIE43_04440 [Patescibacteria group bacterium]
MKKIIVLFIVSLLGIGTNAISTALADDNFKIREMKSYKGLEVKVAEKEGYGKMRGKLNFDTNKNWILVVALDSQMKTPDFTHPIWNYLSEIWLKKPTLPANLWQDFCGFDWKSPNDQTIPEVKCGETVDFSSAIGATRGATRISGFAFDSFALTDWLKIELRSASQNMGKITSITGYCDIQGEIEYNKLLGRQRAESTLEYLKSIKADVSPNVSIISGGETRQFGDYAENRCVVVIE